MQSMTRPEFEAYEKRVEDVLNRIGNSIDEADLEDFVEVAAAARQVVEIRRAHLEITEQQAGVALAKIKQDARSPDADERYYEQTAEAANEALNEIRIAREALGRIAANEHSILPASAYRGDLEHGYEMAANYAVLWDNKYVLEVARVDTELADQLALFEKSMEEYLEAFGAGSAGEPIPHIVEGDAKLLGYYKEGLKEYETDIAIADAENGLAYGGWAFGFAEYWTIEDSEATWERIGQRRNELLEAYAELQQGVGRAHAEIPSMESAIDAAGRSASDDAARSPNQAAEATYQASTREDAVVRHGEKAVATGERLLERLVEAGREMRDSEARLGRYREGDEERDARFEKLVEATSSYNRILGQAVREAVDGNGYIREARWHRDLETAIAMEDLRHEQRDQFHIQNEEFRSRQSDPTEQAFQAGNTGRPEAHQQHMTRLRQIEQEIQDRDRTDRDERDR